MESVTGAAPEHIWVQIGASCEFVGSVKGRRATEWGTVQLN